VTVNIAEASLARSSAALADGGHATVDLTGKKHDRLLIASAAFSKRLGTKAIDQRNLVSFRFSS
jgi:hypothetical protein